MSKRKDNVIAVDKISYVHYKMKDAGGIEKAFIDMRVDGKRHRLVVVLNEDVK